MDNHPSKILIRSFIFCVISFTAAVAVHLQLGGPIASEEVTPVRVLSEPNRNDVAFISPGEFYSGAYARVSTDKQHLVYVKNHGMFCDGERTVNVTNLANEMMVPIVTLTGIDPCSGVSFDTRLIDGSEYVKITGSAYKVGAFNPHYSVSKDILYNL